MLQYVRLSSSNSVQKNESKIKHSAKTEMQAFIENCIRLTVL